MSNARIQQMISLSLALTAVGWLVWCWGTGRSGWTPWALMALAPHAPVLALETAWAAAAARREGARRAMGQADAPPVAYPGLHIWMGAWLQEVVASVRTFGWQQPWQHARHPDHLPPQAAGRQGVLLVHGFVCNRGFWNRWMPELRAAGIPHVAVSLGPPFRDIALQAQGIEQAWQGLMQATGRPPLLVGHSMGGLMIRSWLGSKPREIAQAHEVITIGTPHHGTALAQMARSEPALQMQLLSDFLRSLAEREDAALRARWTCYWSVCDNIVFPANTATLPGARNLCIPGRPHVALAQAPEILQDVMARCAPGRT